MKTGNREAIGVLAILALTISLFYGCASTIKDAHEVDASREAIIIGRVPADRAHLYLLQGWFLYEEEAGEVGELFPDLLGLSGAATKTGYFFKAIPPGDYTIKKFGRKGAPGAKTRGSADVLSFTAEEGTLLDLGAFVKVTDARKGATFMWPSKQFIGYVWYHFEQKRDRTVLERFKKGYPELFESYKDKIITIGKEGDYYDEDKENEVVR